MIHFDITSTALPDLKTDCLVLGIDQSGPLSDIARLADQLSHGQISQVLKLGDLKGQLGKTLYLPLGFLNIKRVLLVNCSDNKPLDRSSYCLLIKRTMMALQHYHISETVLTLHQLRVEACDIGWKVEQTVLAANDSFYTFDQCKSDKLSSSLSTLTTIGLLVSNGDDTSVSSTIKTAGAIAKGVKLCKDLGNMPANICTPSYLAKQAQTLAQCHDSLSVDIIDEAKMKALKMEALLSVSQGSHQPAKLIVIDYKGHANKAPIVLVGKGITFDSGGNNMKSSAGMEGMKYDMCGAGAVFGIMTMLASLKLPINVVGMVAAAENMVDGRATRPTDVVTSLAGMTIEIMNTDAEGRLVLCDALTYCKRFKPENVIDIATLTGGTIIALGFETASLFSNHPALTKALLKASVQSNDAIWHLPMTQEGYQLLKSDIADIKNTYNHGNSTAKTIAAACFLSHFTKDYHWAHLDIAGVAVKPGEHKLATGRPVPLLSRYLINVAQEK